MLNCRCYRCFLSSINPSILDDDDNDDVNTSRWWCKKEKKRMHYDLMTSRDWGRGRGRSLKRIPAASSTLLVMNPVLLTMNTVPCCRAETSSSARQPRKKTKQKKLLALTAPARVRRGSSSYFLFISTYVFISAFQDGQVFASVAKPWDYTAIQLASWQLIAACDAVMWAPIKETHRASKMMSVKYLKCFCVNKRKWDQWPRGREGCKKTKKRKTGKN